ncbi:hypothetical protein CPB86DRAFT_861362 [Serendipita vermifera]|nr:hypothetical protein CPB86DRAFT_861362 [Serendipita vermifera]
MNPPLASRAASTVDALIDAAEGIALTRWCSAVAITILFYDTFLTLEEEVQFLWPKKWNAIKASIYLNRLITFPITIVWSLTHSGRIVYSNPGCEALFHATSVTAYIFFALANWIMLSRTTSLYGNTRIFKWAMSIFFVASYITTGILITISMVSLGHPGHIYFLAPFRICAIAFRPATYGYIWIPALVFETVVCFLTVHKTYQKAIRQYGMGSKLLVVLFRDGVIYYFIIVVFRGYNMISWMTMEPARLFIAFQIMWSLVCVLTTRLQLNLLEAAQNPTAPRSHGHSGTYQLSSFLKT